MRAAVTTRDSKRLSAGGVERGLCMTRALGPRAFGLVALIVFVVGFPTAMVLPPAEFLPSPSSLRTVAAAALAAQASITAISLAVVIFFLQQIHGRLGDDEPLFRRLIRNSQIPEFFALTLGTLAATGIALLLSQPAPDNSPLSATASVRNLTLVVGFAFVMNLAALPVAFFLFLRLLSPSAWRQTKQNLTEQQIRTAIDAHVKRLIQMRETPDKALSLYFSSEPEEDEANEAARRLLEDAANAFRNQHFSMYQDAFAATQKLVEVAKDRLEELDVQFTDPGAGQAHWPPLPQIERQMHFLRRQVFAGGWSDYASAVAAFDYWLVNRGAGWRVGEMYELGLRGMRNSYVQAAEAGNVRVIEALLPRTWRHLRGPMWDELLICAANQGDEAHARCHAYLLRTMIQLDELLNAALEVDRSSDFAELVEGFETLIKSASYTFHNAYEGPEADLIEWLRLEYRISLMAVGGRVVLLHKERRLVSAAPYLDRLRQKLARLSDLTDPIAHVLDDREERQSLWMTWETEHQPEMEASFIMPERYILTYFAVRALELLASDSAPLMLKGNAKRVREFIEGQLESVRPYILLEPEQRFDDQADTLANMLRESEAEDERSDDEDMASSPLDPVKMATYIADVYAARRDASALETVFADADAFKLVTLPDDADPQPRGFSRLTFRAPFTDRPDWHHGPVDLVGNDWERDLLRTLEVALRETPVRDVGSAPSAETFRTAIDEAIEDLAGSQPVLVAIGRHLWQLWHELTVSAVFVPSWQTGERTMFVEGAYRGWPVLVYPDNRSLRVAVIDRASWGCMVRAPYRNQEIITEIEEIDRDRADEILKKKPGILPEQPDDESKIRKLQTQVFVSHWERAWFIVRDPLRARIVQFSGDAE